MIDKEITFFLMICFQLNTTVNMSEVFGWGLAGFLDHASIRENTQVMWVKVWKRDQGKVTSLSAKE